MIKSQEVKGFLTKTPHLAPADLGLCEDFVKLLILWYYWNNKKKGENMARQYDEESDRIESLGMFLVLLFCPWILLFFMDK